MPTITENLQRAALAVGIDIPEAPSKPDKLTAPAAEDAVLDPNEATLREFLTSHAFYVQYRDRDEYFDIADLVRDLGEARTRAIALEVVLAARYRDREFAVSRALMAKLTFTFEELSPLPIGAMFWCLQRQVISPVPSLTEYTAWAHAKKAPFDKILGAWHRLPEGQIDDDTILAISDVPPVISWRHPAEQISARISDAVALTIVREFPERLGLVAVNPVVTEALLLKAYDDCDDWMTRIGILKILAWRKANSRAVGARVHDTLANIPDESLPWLRQDLAAWIMRNWTVSPSRLIELLPAVTHQWLSGQLAKNQPTEKLLREAMDSSEYVRDDVRAMLCWDSAVAPSLIRLREKPPVWLLDFIAALPGIGSQLRYLLTQANPHDQTVRGALPLKALAHALIGTSDVVQERVWKSLGAPRSVFNSTSSFDEIIAVFVERDAEAAARVAAKKDQKEAATK